MWIDKKERTSHMDSARMKGMRVKYDEGLNKTDIEKLNKLISYLKLFFQ